MVKAINEVAYQDLRNYITNNWNFIELRDGSNNPVLRLGTNDSRVNWTHEAGSQTLELTIIVRGSDTEVTLPQTFSGSAIFKGLGATEVLSDDVFTPFSMENHNDELTVRHKIQVPKKLV